MTQQTASVIIDATIVDATNKTTTTIVNAAIVNTPHQTARAIIQTFSINPASQTATGIIDATVIYPSFQAATAIVEPLGRSSQHKQSEADYHQESLHGSLFCTKIVKRQLICKIWARITIYIGKNG